MKRIILLTTLLFLTGPLPSAARESSNEPTVLNGRECEYNLAVLWHNLITEAKRTGERVFVIARLGKGETSRRLTHRRLHNARTYVAPHLRSGGAVFAEGERTDREGRVEFYLGSKLKQVALLARGGDLCLCCCEGCEHYYGWGKKDGRKRQR